MIIIDGRSSFNISAYSISIQTDGRLWKQPLRKKHLLLFIKKYYSLEELLSLEILLI